MGYNVGYKRKGSSKSKKSSTKRRTKDLDEISATDPVKLAEKLKNAIVDEELPGGGQFYCLECDRHFVGAKALGTHKRSKVHKRRLKELAEGAYTLEEANAAAGRGAPDYGKPEAVADAEEDKEM